jgi:hypothetical protein
MRIFFLVLCTSLSALYAQPKKIKSLSFQQHVVGATVDRPGDLYLTFQNGEIRKISKEGEHLASTKYNAPPDLFDPRDGVLAFAFFRATNRFDYLGTDLSVSDSQVVHPEFAINPWLVCPSRNEIWIMDSVDLSLKKTGASLHVIEKDINWQAPVTANEVAYVREYQNFLFILSHDKGIFVVNSMGKLIKSVAAKGIPYFNFLGEEMYYPVGNTLQLMDLYSGETRTLPLPQRAEYALITDERMFLIQDDRLDIFEIVP